MVLKPETHKPFIGELTTTFLNGKIYTMDKKQPVVEAVVIGGNRILFAGTEEEARKKYHLSKIKDLQKRTMLPGFIDPHVHMIFAAMDHWVDLGPYKDHEIYTKDKVEGKLISAIKGYKNPGYLLACQLFDPMLV